MKKVIKKVGKRIREKIPPIPPSWDRAWILQHLKDIERAQKIIIADQQDLDESLTELQRETGIVLNKINELQKALGPPGSTTDNITPELATAITKSSTLTTKIDEKVPDKNVPPGTGTP
jgi:hypothetical protein